MPSFQETLEAAMQTIKSKPKMYSMKICQRILVMRVMKYNDENIYWAVRKDIERAKAENVEGLSAMLKGDMPKYGLESYLPLADEA